MAGQFLSPDGDLEKIFVDDYAMIDQYAKTGSLWVWGQNTAQWPRLGDNTIVSKSSAVQTIAGGTNWKQVSTSTTNTAAIKTDGTLWLWGGNASGQLGNNTATFNGLSSPVQTISGGTNWKQVSVGVATTAAIKTDGTLWLWGENLYGQLGDNTIVKKSSPVQTIAGGTNWKQVTIGNNLVAAIKTDGTLWLWGNNFGGRIGDNTNAVHKSSPVQTIAGGTNWKQVSCSDTNTAAIKTDGTLWLWGKNNYGQLGNGQQGPIDANSPVQTISGGTNWKQVSAGSSTTAAIKTDGTLWVWGNNSYGQLGDNTIVKKSSPVQTIAGGTNWKQVLVSGHIAAIKTDGTLWVWGANSYGQLGDNTTIRKSTPIQTIAGGTNWKEISISTNGTAALHFYDAGNLYPSK